MKVLTNKNSIMPRPAADATLTLVHKAESFLLYQRRAKTLKLIADCKQYISSGSATEELKERIKELKDQDITLSTMETIVILLDYAERETIEIEKLEKNETSFFSKIKKILSRFF